MSASDASRASAALEHLEVLRRHVAAPSEDEELRFDAICMRLAAAIEDASKISEAGRQGAFNGRWPAIWATRNRITHGYAFVSRDVVMATVAHDLDEFEAGLRVLTGERKGADRPRPT